jgi:hypothetical protein
MKTESLNISTRIKRVRGVANKKEGEKGEQRGEKKKE